MFVGVTGFEPAASSSRTKRATELRYTPFYCLLILPLSITMLMSRTIQYYVMLKGTSSLGKQSGRPVSNRRPSAWEADALPTELHPLTRVKLGL